MVISSRGPTVSWHYENITFNLHLVDPVLISPPQIFHNVFRFALHTQQMSKLCLNWVIYFWHPIRETSALKNLHGNEWTSSVFLFFCSDRVIIPYNPRENRAAYPVMLPDCFYFFFFGKAMTSVQSHKTSFSHPILFFLKWYTVLNLDQSCLQ